MDGQIPQPENQADATIVVKSPGSIFKNAVFISTIALLLGFGLGFLAKSIIPVNNIPTSSQKAFTLSSVPPKPTIDESKLPVSLSLLTNPIVYQWRGSVEGLLVKKDTNNITLSKDGKTLNIPIDPEKTMVFDPRTGKTTNGIESTTFSTIPLNSYIRGSFFVTPTSQDKNLIIGDSFMIVIEKTPASTSSSSVEY